MAWRVHVCDTTSGAVLSELPFSDLSWSDSLDFTQPGSLSVTVSLETDPVGLDRIRSVARGPWRHTLLLAWDDTAVVAGPLVTHRVDPEQTHVELGCAGPAALLAARIVVAPGHELTPDQAGADVALGPTSLPQIAKLLVDQAIAADASAAAGVSLPLVTPTGLPISDDRTRNYLATDLASYAERLGQLSQVEDGPEIHLTPVLAPDQRSMSWQVRIGTPYLGATTPWTWTLGGSCVGIGVDYDASQETNRAYVAGRTETLAGSIGAVPAVQITPVGTAEDFSLLGVGWPLLERTDRGTGTGADDADPTKAELTAQAREFVRVHQAPVESWHIQIRADATPRVGTYLLGDPARLVHHGHRWIGDGISTRRITGHSGDASDTITLAVTDTAGPV